MKFFSSSSASYLGIDIGSTSIKVVEIKKEGGQPKLLTYGFTESLNVPHNYWQSNVKHTAEVICQILDECGAISRSAVAALPTFSVFSSIINLPNVNKKDIQAAINWEAKKVIPLPLEEMILHWNVIEDMPGKDEQGNAAKNNTKILLTSAPRSLAKKYMDIFAEAKITLLGLETETFSLARSLVGNDRAAVMLAEIGALTTDVSIICNGIPMLNRSIDVGGTTITKNISQRLNIGPERAEQFKYDLGISSMESASEEVPKIIIETISPVVNEIKYAINLFQNKHNQKVEKVILSGGSALLPNLVSYLNKVLDIKIIIGDPWSRISYPVDLRPLLNEIGPFMSVAIGLALHKID